MADVVAGVNLTELAADRAAILQWQAETSSNLDQVISKSKH